MCPRLFSQTGKTRSQRIILTNLRPPRVTCAKFQHFASNAQNSHCCGAHIFTDSEQNPPKRSPVHCILLTSLPTAPLFHGQVKSGRCFQGGSGFRVQGAGCRVQGAGVSADCGNLDAARVLEQSLIGPAAHILEPRPAPLHGLITGVSMSALDHHGRQHVSNT